jgi:hypothetical protein
VATGEIVKLNSSTEKEASTFSGYIMLVALVLVVALQLFGIISLASDNISLLPIAAVVVGPLLLILIAPGFYMLQQTRPRRSLCSAITSGRIAPPACAGPGRG